MSTQPWPVGTKVAWYGPYDSTATGIAEVEKVYKTGHVVVRGRRFRMWNDESAGETGGGYSRASVRLLTPEAEKEISKHRKTQVAKRLGEWLQKCDVDALPDDAMAALIAVMKSTDQQTNK